MNTAEDMKIDFSEYNTTLTAAIYNGKNLYYGQCGDGGIIVLTPSGNYDCATEVKREKHSMKHIRSWAVPTIGPLENIPTRSVH